MTSYITRRKRWDENTPVSDSLLVDCLLDCSNFSKNAKRLIQTACWKKSDFENTATALRKQHADIHKRDRRSKHEEDKNKAYRTFA